MQQNHFGIFQFSKLKCIICILFVLILSFITSVNLWNKNCLDWHFHTAPSESLHRDLYYQRFPQTANETTILNGYEDLIYEPNIPVEYQDEVDLRIIVMTFKRNESLRKCLDSLQDIVLDGAKAVLNIWIDLDKNHTIHNATLKTANTFRWNLGPVRVHIQKYHVGIYGQWIDTWRPKVDTKEIAIFVEDDVDLSPYVYRWTKAAHERFQHRTDVSGYGLSEDSLMNYRGTRMRLPNDIVFMFRRFGTHGFSPHPLVWRRFQDWYHYQKEYEPNFKPYVEEDYAFTSWYKAYEKRNFEDSMWSMWFEYFVHYHNLYAVFPNIKRHMHTVKGIHWHNASLALHRKVLGLHSKGDKTVENTELFLLRHWDDYFIKFPNRIYKIDYSSKVVSHPYI